MKRLQKKYICFFIFLSTLLINLVFIPVTYNQKQKNKALVLTTWLNNNLELIKKNNGCSSEFLEIFNSYIVGLKDKDQDFLVQNIMSILYETYNQKAEDFLLNLKNKNLISFVESNRVFMLCRTIDSKIYQIKKDSYGSLEDLTKKQLDNIIDFMDHKENKDLINYLSGAISKSEYVKIVKKNWKHLFWIKPQDNYSFLDQDVKLFEEEDFLLAYYSEVALKLGIEYEANLFRHKSNDYDVDLIQHLIFFTSVSCDALRLYSGIIGINNYLEKNNNPLYMSRSLGALLKTNFLFLFNKAKIKKISRTEIKSQSTEIDFDIFMTITTDNGLSKIQACGFSEFANEISTLYSKFLKFGFFKYKNLGIRKLQTILRLAEIIENSEFKDMLIYDNGIATLESICNGTLKIVFAKHALYKEVLKTLMYSVDIRQFIPEKNLVYNSKIKNDCTYFIETTRTFWNETFPGHNNNWFVNFINPNIAFKAYNNSRLHDIGNCRNSKQEIFKKLYNHLSLETCSIDKEKDFINPKSVKNLKSISKEAIFCANCLTNTCKTISIKSIIPCGSTCLQEKCTVKKLYELLKILDSERTDKTYQYLGLMHKGKFKCQPAKCQEWGADFFDKIIDIWLEINRLKTK